MALERGWQSSCRPGLGSQPERGGAIIRQRDLHIGTEDTTGYRGVAAKCLSMQVVEQALPFCRHSGGREAWPHPPAGIRRERKLWHQEQAPAYV